MPRAAEWSDARPRPPVAPAAEICACPDLLGAKGRAISNYRCNILNENGDIIFPGGIVAPTLDAAIKHGYCILRTSNQSTSPSRAGQTAAGEFP
jgi:hypothetical protein